MSTAPYDAIAAKWKRGDLVILDGGTGTDIQRRGVPMHGETWCAEANLTHPLVVQAVHEDYIRAGSDVITINTYPTSPLLFDALGRADDVARIDRIAIDIAKRARDTAAGGRTVAIAGSMSVMRPAVAGSDRTVSDGRSWNEREVRALYRAKAETMKAAGVDLIMMEMMRDTTYSVWASEAAMESGLPVWIGIALETKTTGKLTGYGRPEEPGEAVIGALAALKPAALNIMHTAIHDVDIALPLLQARTKGPIGVYPELGYFKMPDWQFSELSPHEFVGHCNRWRSAGVAMLGGCCGIGPAHIAELAKSASGQEAGRV
jgi:S-methylmethionine-dependent homocysteine/selenocysteine methylase